MQKILLMLMLALVLASCGNSGRERYVGGGNLGRETDLEMIAMYPTVESYYESIEFVDEKKPVGDPYTPIYYEIQESIGEINIGEYYEDFRDSIEVLEAKRKELSASTQIAYLTPSTNQNSIYEFLKQRESSYIAEGQATSDFPAAVTALAKGNKQRLDSLTKKYEEQPESMEVIDLEKLVLLREENGDYDVANQLWAKVLCKRYPKNCSLVQLKIQGLVKDDKLAIVPDVKIEVLNDFSLGVFTAEKDGTYEFEIEVRPYQLVRVRYSARGYMSLIKEIRIGPKKKTGYEEIAEVRLSKAKETRVIKIVKDESVNIDTQAETTYQVQANSLEDESGAPYTGAVEVSIFDFDSSVDDMGGVLEGSLRISDEGGVVPQDGFISYGMAYIIFNTDSRDVLRVSKKNPITVIAKIVEQQKLYEDYREEGQDVDAFWKYWMEYSKKTGGFIGHGGGNNFPSYWAYNQETGIWDEVLMEIIAPGEVRSIFYTHN